MEKKINLILAIFTDFLMLYVTIIYLYINKTMSFILPLFYCSLYNNKKNVLKILIYNMEKNNFVRYESMSRTKMGFKILSFA